MVKRMVVLAAAVGMLGSAPRVAGAADLWFDNYCIMGGLQVCASVRLNASADGKTLTMQVWNLYGTMGLQHTMTSIGLYHTSAGTKFGGTVTGFAATYVNGGSNDDITDAWSAKGAADINNLAGIKLELKTGTGGNDGIVGCEPYPGGGTKWATCNSFPNPAYVQFTFTLSEAFSLDDVALRWHSQQIGPDDISLKCDTGGAGDYPPCSVVPEPISMLLLGTGLAGLGGVGALRRRRKGLDVTDA